MMAGKKTYAIAFLMVIHAVIGKVTRMSDGADVGPAIQELLTAFGLGALRNGIK